MKNKKILVLLIIAIIAIIIGFFFNQNNKITPEAIEPEHQITKNFPGAKGDYTIDIRMDENNIFHIRAEIDVTNLSEDIWETVGFNFVPNALTKENGFLEQQDTSEVTMESITILGDQAEYELESNKLLVKLKNSLTPNEKTTIRITYSMEIPEYGYRLGTDNQNYYLGHWYPMLANYAGDWIIRDYVLTGETYETGYGSYKVTYDLPQDFFVASSGSEGVIKETTNGTIEGDQIKDFYIAFLHPDKWVTEEAVVNDTTLRLFVPLYSENLLESMLEISKDSFGYLEEKIGDNPSTELDIIANNGGMEYPNIIEVHDFPEQYKTTLVHEIVHQWFYYMIPSDPYQDAWLDESITVLVTSLYLSEKEPNQGHELVEMNKRNPPANQSIEDLADAYVMTIYRDAPAVMYKFFHENGGTEEAFQFFSAYFDEFQFKYVNTASFIKFFHDYYEGKHDKELKEWLEI